jgi:hypothetical protein
MFVHWGVEVVVAMATNGPCLKPKDGPEVPVVVTRNTAVTSRQLREPNALTASPTQVERNTETTEAPYTGQRKQVLVVVEPLRPEET